MERINVTGAAQPIDECGCSKYFKLGVRAKPPAERVNVTGATQPIGMCGCRRVSQSCLRNRKLVRLHLK
ncbi:unnamed protein product [Strongylus vulgaris]|uniref:Uncharacterized protein n=1 Tax=Strongylus vulgaris TaxID=40348 RepID=A0A3P7J0Q0_STRVU|nr:unnamed protein product [Strongylus vulgaris]